MRRRDEIAKAIGRAVDIAAKHGDALPLAMLIRKYNPDAADKFAELIVREPLKGERAIAARKTYLFATEDMGLNVGQAEDAIKIIHYRHLTLREATERAAEVARGTTAICQPARERKMLMSKDEKIEMESTIKAAFAIP